MYCPTCGSEERQLSQYCRACGTDLRVVRIGLEKPDAITASAVSAREQISRALADKIRQMGSSHDLKVFNQTSAIAEVSTNELRSGDRLGLAPSVTEHTTHQLKPNRS